MMNRTKYAEIMNQRSLYVSGQRTREAINAQRTYNKWQEQGLVQYYKQKYGKKPPITDENMCAEKYAEIMSLRQAYTLGTRTPITRKAHAIYAGWLKKGLAAEYKERYAKFSKNEKLLRVSEVLATDSTDAQKVKEITEIMKR